MKRLLLLPAALGVLGASPGPPISYEGPISKRGVAIQAFEQAKSVCPRLGLASKDIKDYSLHVGIRGGKGLYGQAATAYDADVLVVIVLRVVERPSVIPTSIRPQNGFADLALIASDSFSGVMVNDPVAFWLCEKSPDPGIPMALLPAASIHKALSEP